MTEALLGNVCNINPSFDKTISDNMECSFVPMEDVDEILGTIVKADIRYVEEVKKGYTYFREGDVIFAKITPCMENGKCAVARDLKNGIGFGSTEFHVVRARKDIIPEYIFYFLRQETIRKQATHWFRGTAGQQRVPATFLKELVIPLPPLDEQRRIAARLCRADQLRRLRRYASQLGEGYLQSAFLEMFGDPVRNEKGWNVFPLAELCEQRNGIKAGPFGSSLKKNIYTSSGVRIYGQEQVIGGSFSIGDYYISEEMFEKKFKTYQVKPNDVLISLVGTFGKTIIVPEGIEPGIINPRLLKISPKKKMLNSVFLSQFLQLEAVQNRFAELSHGGTMGILNAGQLKEFEIICPPLAEQERFAARVARYERLRSQQREAERQGEMLFQSLLADAFE